VPRRPGGRLAGGLWGLLSFRLLFLATAASAAGTWLASVALVLDIWNRTGSASWVSALLVAEFVPFVAVGLAAGPLVDRLDRRRLLIASDLARAAVFALLPFATSALQIVLLALIAGVATSIFRPALYASVPTIVPDELLTRANGLLQAAENAAFALGPLAGGLLVGLAGPDPAYWVNAASFLVSAGLVLRVRLARVEKAEIQPAHWRALRAGLRLARRSRPLLVVLVVWSIVGLATGIVNVSEVVLAKEALGTGDAGYGLMLTAMGCGLLLGSLRAGGAIERVSVRAAYLGAVTLMGIATAVVAAAPSLWVALPALVVAGFGNGVAIVGNVTLIQRGVVDSMRGRALTLAMSATSTAIGAGMIATGPLVVATGPRAAWGIAAGLVGLASLVGLVLTRRLEPAEVATPAQQGI
jgi:MFS family permease